MQRVLLIYIYQKKKKSTPHILKIINIFTSLCFRKTDTSELFHAIKKIWIKEDGDIDGKEGGG
jgi:hypothetical protein